MISVMVSKWVADASGADGIYAHWIALRQYPWLPSREFRDHGETAAHVMKPAEHLAVVHDGASVAHLEEVARRHGVRSFPVVRGEMLLGIVMRDKLRACVGGFSLLSARVRRLTMAVQRGLWQRTRTGNEGVRSFRPARGGQMTARR